MITAGLNTRLFTLGNANDPHLYIYSNEQGQGEVGLYTIDGVKIDSMQVTYEAGQVKDILLGDWLDQKISEEGFYIITVLGTPLLLLAVEVSMSTWTPDQPYLRRIVIYDKNTGLVTELPPNTPNIPASNRYITVRYYHDEEQGLGKLIINEGLSTQEIDWARFTILKQTFTFTSKEAMLRFMIRHAWAMDRARTEALGKIAEVDLEKALSIMGLYGIGIGLGRMLNYNVDVANLKLEVSTFVPLGFGWDNIKRGLMYAAAGAIAGAAIGAAAFISIATVGTGTIAGLAIAGAGIGMAYGILASTENIDDSSFQQQLYDQYSKGLQNTEQAYNKAINDLGELHNQGQISDEAYNTLKQDIDTLYNIAVQSIKDVYETAKSGYKEGYKAGYKAGYNKAKSEIVKWIIGAAAAGFIGGVAITK